VNIALLGATGLSGVAVLKEALARDHRVRVLARKPSALPAHDSLTVLEGNALAEADLDKCVAGCEAVVHCLGVGGKGDGKPTTLCSESVQLLLPIMRRHGAKRLVVMSNYWSNGSGAWFMRKVMIPTVARWLVPILVDKDRMEALLRDCKDLDWIAPRFPGIVEGPAKPVRTGDRVGIKITTGSVATFMLDQLTDDTFVRSAPNASN
jgi:putative NADH-flavin reductase